MENREVSEVLSHSGFKTDREISILGLARSGKEDRLSAIRNPNENHDKRCHCAALEISRCWRGYRCRVKMKELFMLNDSNVEQDNAVQPETSLPTKIEESDSVPSQQESIQVMDKINSGSTGLVTIPQDLNITTSSDTSTKEPTINGEKSSNLDDDNVATTDSTHVPSSQSPIFTSRGKLLTKNRAAAMIQKCWRRHIDTQVFRYYRDLINFRRQGNPALMLRCINPTEAKLLDAATGTHIKFRLAGEKFPPNIYYKIYTHRPVVDMCANSPKDYTKADAKQANFKQLHTKNQPLPDTDVKDGWYRRFENNGWRLVSDRLIHAAMDPTTWETSQKKVEFHHDKLVRQADLDKRRREKKIAWMHKMYKKGMLQVKVEDPETSDLVKKAADGLINTVDSQGPEGVMDWEVDELLQWTTALNFDDYLEGWKETATSNMSEFEVEEMISEKVSKTTSKHDVNFVSYSIYNENKDQTPNYTPIQVPQS